jgi:hypothetical protein
MLLQILEEAEAAEDKPQQEAAVVLEALDL